MSKYPPPTTRSSTFNPNNYVSTRYLDKTKNETISGAYTFDNNVSLTSGKTYKINGLDVLSSSTLGSGVTSSSLTSLGTLTSLAVTGDLTVDTTTLTVDSANNKVGVVKSLPAYPLDVTGDMNMTGALRLNGTAIHTSTTCKVGSNWAPGVASTGVVIKYGKVVPTPAGTITGTVTFPSNFSGTPNVWATVDTDYTGSAGITVSGASSTGFNWRITAGGTLGATSGFHWLAIGT